MKISVVTVCFNAAQTIVECLQSVACQTHADTEHIIVDGGSGDRTLDLIQEQGRHVTRLVSEPDDGIYDAMNKGLCLATGEVIGFLNADDAYSNDRVLDRVAQAMLDPGLDALFGDAEFFDSNRPVKSVRRYRSHRFRPDRIAWGWMPAHPTLFLRRRTFDSYGPFRTDYRIAGDFELVARMFHDGSLRYRYLPEVLVRMRTGGISTRGYRNTLILNREVLRACRENDIPTNIPKILSKYPLKLFEFLRTR